jgi:hypothetical protein
MAFKVTNVDGGQNRINSSLFSSELFRRLDEKTAEEIKALPADLLKAVRLAQIVEADDIMGGDATEKLREQGLLSKTVGESSQMFRSGKADRGVLCKRASKILAKYIVKQNTIGRG